MAVTANNLANVNTPGYQATRVQFSDWLSPQQQGAALPGEPKIAYTQDRATWRDTEPGTVTHTGNPYDLSVRNGGFFTVATPNGPRLTRDGKFGPLPDGTIGDAAGNALLSANGPADPGRPERYPDHHHRATERSRVRTGRSAGSA